MNPDHDLLEQRLRQDGAAFRDAGRAWDQDRTDVVRRSHRQQRTARNLTAAALALLVVAGGGLAVGRATRNDDRVIMADNGTVAPAPSTSVVPTTGGPPPTSSPPVTSSLPTTVPTVTAPPSTAPTTTTPATTTPATTSVPTTVAPTTIPTTVRAATPQLRTDGLGVAAFNEDEDTAMASLVEAFGAPTRDDGWTPDDNNPVGTHFRHVQWGALSVDFVDTATGPRFMGWRLDAPRAESTGHTPDLQNPDGFRVGMTVAEARPLLDPFEVIDGGGASGYLLRRSGGGLYLFFDPPYYSFGAPPGDDATIAILAAGTLLLT